MQYEIIAVPMRGLSQHDAKHLMQEVAENPLILAMIVVPGI
jgi:hypothetical protein